MLSSIAVAQEEGWVVIVSEGLWCRSFFSSSLHVKVSLGMILLSITASLLHKCVSECGIVLYNACGSRWTIKVLCKCSHLPLALWICKYYMQIEEGFRLARILSFMCWTEFLSVSLDRGECHLDETAHFLVQGIWWLCAKGLELSYY